MHIQPVPYLIFPQILPHSHLMLAVVVPLLATLLDLLILFCDAEKYFKPLVVPELRGSEGLVEVPTASGSPAKLIASQFQSSERMSDAPTVSLRYLDFDSFPPPGPFSIISLLPSLSQRRRAHAWAVILSGLCNAGRRHPRLQGVSLCRCGPTLMSVGLKTRLYAHTVYLSVGERLSQLVSGCQLALVHRGSC